VIPGRVRNGVIVLEGGPALPEGAAVDVSYFGPAEPEFGDKKPRIQVPLVHSTRPGSVNLTGEQIARIMDDEDAARR